MSDPLRLTTSHDTIDAVPEADREAKIEQLLLAGLDHYFAAQYEQAINVWTRVLFLDRSHARARAYIERARSALAERQRESEELLQSGVAAFQRGEGDEARRLLQAAIERGAPSEEALARARSAGTASKRVRRRAVRTRSAVARAAPPPLAAPAVAATRAAIGAAIAALRSRWRAGPGLWRGRASLWTCGADRCCTKCPAPPPQLLSSANRAAAAAARRDGAGARARAGGDRTPARRADGARRVRPTDPQQAEADRLRGESSGSFSR